jgi:hypothetical protein
MQRTVCKYRVVWSLDLTFAGCEHSLRGRKCQIRSTQAWSPIRALRLNPPLARQARQIGHVRPVSPRHARSRKRAGSDGGRGDGIFEIWSTGMLRPPSLTALLRLRTPAHTPGLDHVCTAARSAERVNPPWRAQRGLRGGQTLATWTAPGAAIRSSLTVSSACDQEPKSVSGTGLARKPASCVRAQGLLARPHELRPRPRQ